MRTILGFPRPALPTLAFLVVVLSDPASAEFVGLDVNADFQCERFDMGWVAGEGDIGSIGSIQVYFDDLPPAYGWGCVFCVTEKSRIGDWSWTFLPPGPWPQEWNSVVVSDPGPLPVAVSPFITISFPNRKCWYATSYDFSFSYPIEAYPHSVGILEYEVAEEGEIQWVIDGPNTGVQSTGMASYFFGDPGEACSGPAATEATSWGSVKALFR